MVSLGLHNWTKGTESILEQLDISQGTQKIVHFGQRECFNLDDPGVAGLAKVG